MEATNVNTTITNDTTANEQLTAAQQELTELKEMQYQQLVKELDIDSNYLEIINSQVDKNKKITEIKTDLNNLLMKYPKFKTSIPVTGGVVTNKSEQQKTTTNNNENQSYDGLTPQLLKLKLKEGK
ncbi:MAG: hypothetical protein PPFGHCPK_01102 [Spiroplasma endosymbiont of Drosophila atripex]|nr:MAG: hypothetical protein PPFGHCPK_01102 [Spiroplasma endosymbiont of Drosophila atripex]